MVKSTYELFHKRNSVENKKSEKIVLFRPMILSRHPSHDCLRSKYKNLPLLPYKSVVRFGSTTDLEDTISNGGNRIEINSIDSIKNSANKLLMKQKFTEANVKTANWITKTQADFSDEEIEVVGFPIVAKNHYGSKGKGNTLLKTKEELEAWLPGKTMSNYIFEKFMNYAHEFRLHITEEGCFYACRKALKKDCNDEDKWRHHDDNCVWFLENNDLFYKPNSWEDIVRDCVNALKAIGADVLSFDVKVQSPMNSKGEPREYQQYILLECNSASSMNNGTEELSICATKYIEQLRKLIIKKSQLK